MTTQRQNPDGSWSPAEPLGYMGGLDWEVYDRKPGVRSRHRAELFDKAVNLAVVHARWRWLLRRRMLRAERRVENLLRWAHGTRSSERRSS